LIVLNEVGVLERLEDLVCLVLPDKVGFIVE
jgi:hypothetical protein